MMSAHAHKHVLLLYAWQHFNLKQRHAASALGFAKLIKLVHHLDK